MLTAGQGTRLRPYTENTPKPALGFLNLPLAYYGFYLAKQAGFTQFLLNKHHLPNQIEELAKELSQFTQNVETIDETKKLLGSAGAIWNAREIIAKHEYFLIANGDEILLPQDKNILNKLVSRFKETKTLCCLLTCEHPDLLKTLKPVWVNDAGDVQAFGMEKPSSKAKPVHYTGYKVFSKRILDFLPEGESNIFYDVLIQAIADGNRVGTLHLENSAWHETGDFDSFLKASREVATNNLPEINERLSFFSKKTLITNKNAESFVVHPDGENPNSLASLRGTVVLGEHCSLGKGAHLENVIVSSKVTILENSKHLNCII